ncbi:MAG: phosphoadenosine phosphosulfate reductase family protein [Candidatus Latescibacteria bacterium]|nr:phosphoadenosine phosphosulfate reductase family protein [Candidatus Latescibacterota bacterium]
MADLEVLNKKVDDSKKIIREAFEKYPLDKLAVSWTGGKESTLVLYIMRQICAEDGIALPRCFSIDEGDMFPEIKYMFDAYTAEWGLQLDMVHNHDVSKVAGGELGGEVSVADLNERNRAEIERLGYEEDTFDYEPESYVGNHLMKTVVLNGYIEDNGLEGFFGGIRWDEQEARQNETHFSLRPATDLSPAHERISPILHFTERDVWDATFAFEIPFCTLYNHGYRSLGARITTVKAADVPAWEQDLENTMERGGRRQDKESIMEKMRNLGYM